MEDITKEILNKSERLLMSTDDTKDSNEGNKPFTKGEGAGRANSPKVFLR